MLRDKLKARTQQISKHLFGQFANKREFGDQVEAQAVAWLQQQKIKILQQNYLCKMGEIDIIAQDTHNLIFIEVRYRRDNRFGGALASVNRKKQRRVMLAASHYMQKYGLTNKCACRFDVMAISGSLNRLEFNWIKAAFQA